MENELRAVDKLCKPGPQKNIVTALRHGKLPQTSYYFLDMELCDMNLETHIRQEWPPTVEGTKPHFSKDVTPENRRDEVIKIMKDIAGGVSYIHRQGEIHRDLKPRNGMSSSFQT